MEKERGLIMAKGKGIYKRGEIFWIAYAGLDGKIIRETSKSKKFKEAEGVLIQRRQSIREGKMPEIKVIKNHTFNDLVTDYLKWAERQRACSKKEFVVNQLKERFDKLPLRRFDTKLVEAYQSERLHAGKKILKNEEIMANKPATINRHIATLKHMFTKAVEWEMVEEDTLKRIRRAKMLEENNRRLRYLSKEECHTLIDACVDYLKPIVITALNTGMRKGEILSLKWDNIDMNNGFILLDSGMTKNGERREIPINATLRATLEELYKGTVKKPRRIDVPHVFYRVGKADSTAKAFDNVHRSFTSACKRAKIRDFHFHDLRHCFASHLVMAGIDITTVKELLGHKTLTMTLRYAHLAPSHKVKAVDILDQALNTSPTSQKLHKNEGAANV
jgi:integrase